jgi:glutathione S-transferase
VDGSVTLKYFDIRGKAEPIRLLLEETQVAYRDVRVTAEQWARQKNDTRILFGQLPLLIDGDMNIVQSYGIMVHINATT